MVIILNRTFYLLSCSLSVILGIFVAEYVINSDFKTVSVSGITRSTIENYIELTGEVKEINKREIKIDYPVEIKKIYVDIGEKVKKGQKIAEIDKESLLTKFEFAMAESSSKDNYENIITSLKYYPEIIESPINGVVSDILISEGETCAMDIPVFIVTDLENLVVRTKIKSDRLSNINLGQKALICLKDNTVTGKISKIYPSAEKDINENLSSVSFEITPDDSKNLICGTVVDVKIANETLEDIVVVPFDSVMFDESMPYVYINKSGYAVKRQVITGKEFETTIEIKAGLSEKDKLILNPRKYNLKNGDKISDGDI